MAIEKEDYKYHFLLYLVSPVLALIYGLRSGSKSYVRWTIFIFTVIYGSLLTFSVMGGKRGANAGADGAQHLNKVYDEYQYKTFDTFWSELLEIFSLSGQAPHTEPYPHILSYIFGSILNAPGAFFVGVGLVYGYFFSGSLVKLLSYVNWKSNYNKVYFFYFLVFFILWFNLKDMNTVRTWTGMWVLIYATISHYQTKKIKYLLLALVPPFIHIGFSAMALPVWLVLFTGYRNPKFYFILFILSTLFSSVTQESGVYDRVAQTSSIAQNKVQGYAMTDEKIEGQENIYETSNSNFYKLYSNLGIHKKVLSALVIFIFLSLRNVGFTKIENTLFSYGLALASFANFATYISALHNRTWGIAGTYILALVVIFLSTRDFKNISFSFLKLKLPLFLFASALLPMLLLKFSMLLNMGSVFLLFVPFVSWINPEIGINMRDLIVMILTLKF